MTTDALRPAGVDKLEAALDIYGADRTRWPAPLRHELSGLIAGNVAARKLLQEGEAFDRLLDLAPQYDAARLEILRERIAAAAVRQPRLLATPSTTARRWLRRSHGIAGTALAASLVLGLFAGQSKVISSTADMLLSGGSSGYSNSSQQLAQTDDADSLLDEDLL